MGWVASILLSPDKLACCSSWGMTSYRTQDPSDHHPEQVASGCKETEEWSLQTHEVRVPLASSPVS